MKKIVTLNESQLVSLINEAVEYCLNEGLDNIYHDDALRDVVLFIENDADTYKQLEWLRNALAKKIKRGVVPDVNYLANCSTMKHIFQTAMRKYVRMAQEYEYDVPRLDNQQKQKVRLHMANLIMDWLSCGETF